MIAFDLQAVQSVAHGERGIARFVADLAAALASDLPDAVDVFLWNDLLPRAPKLDTLGLGDRLRSFSEMRGQTVDVLHLNSPFEGLRIGDFMPPVRARRVVATCYDLIPYRFPLEYLGNTLARARYRNRLAMLTVADAVVTDSQSAADDAAELLGIDQRRLTVIGAGVGPQFSVPATSLAERIDALRVAVPGIEPRFVLVPTGMDWRKNTMAAIEAYAQLPAELRARHQLVLSCRLDEHHRVQFDAHCDRLGVTEHVLVTDFVSDETLVTLYQSAELVYFASLYEGFGLPVLEARRCGARVICANTSSLPEVLPDSEAWFNPYDIAEMAALLERSLTDMAFAARLDAIPDAGFDWHRAARRTVDVYRSLLDGLSTPVTPSARRLAIVSPLPPVPNGVANHSHRLIEAMHRDLADVDVTAFVPWGASGLQGEVDYPVREISSLPTAWAAGEFDAVLYVVGNHEVHRRVLPMLELVPGHVLVHDARLLGALDPPQWHRAMAEGTIDADSRCVAPFARRACSLLVQSRYAAELVSAETGCDPVDVGPIHVPAVERSTIERGDDTTAPPWVVTAGVADHTKRTDVFVAAARSLTAAGVARTAVVGPLGEQFVGDGGEVGGGEIVVTGWVTDPELDAWLERAAVVVALRDGSNGESSGIVADALARGCVTVVSDVGAMAELPDDVVVKIDAGIDEAELATVIGELLADADRMAAISTATLAYAAEHTPVAQARRVVDAVFGTAG